jgi:phosphoglucomutase
VFTQKNYTENFVQCILEANGAALNGSTLVVGGDGRFYGKESSELIVRMCAANGVTKYF